MTTTITRAADLPRVPWRNGQGLTTEIAVGGPAENFTWRVSLAEVAHSGEFSAFPGIDRIITLVEGGTMTLHLPERTHLLRPDEPFSFDGGLPVRCEVDRPTRDLNVMTRRGSAWARLDVHRLSASDEPLALPASGTDPDAAVDPPTVVLLVLGGTVRLVSDGIGPVATLSAGDAAVTLDAMVLEGTGRVAVATVRAITDR